MKLFENLEARWQAWWPELAPREQRMVLVAGALVGAALLWWIALSPALATLRSAPAEHAKLDAQLQQMAALQAQAKALQAQPRATRDDALRALETSVRQSFGANAQLQTTGAGEGVNIQMRAAPADALAQWFGQARSNARAVPREVHLTRSQAASSANTNAKARTGDAASVQWDGTLVMNLPAR